MVTTKVAEKFKFIFYVRRALMKMRLTCFKDGTYIRGQLVIKLRENALVRREQQAKFASERLNTLSKEFGLHSLDQLFRETNEEMLKGLYRLTFERTDLDMDEVAEAYEKDEVCLFAMPNFVIAPLTAVKGQPMTMGRG